jgi:proline racemase
MTEKPEEVARMLSKRLIITADSHTLGEPTRLVIGGIIHYPGGTMKEKQAYVAREYDSIRKALMGEPRGHRDMFGGFITPPATSDGDVGVVFMDNQGYLNMCGHATIGLLTTLGELGMVPITQLRTQVKIDTPAGRVTGYFLNENGRTFRAGFQNVPAFCARLGEQLVVDGIGEVEVGIAYGGNLFAILPADSVGIQLSLKNMAEIRKMGMKIKTAINQHMALRHPPIQGVAAVDIVTFYGPPDKEQAKYKDVHIFADGQVDRSPGGTGTSALLAYLAARGEIALQETIMVEGLAGGLFEGRLTEAWVDEGVTYYTPEVSGLAYLTGINLFYLNSEDPMLQGIVT